MICCLFYLFIYIFLYFYFLFLFALYLSSVLVVFFFSSRRRHTSCALVTGVQPCALPISVAELHIRAGYQDSAGLEQLSARCKAITTEFENVPADSLRTLALRSRVSPSGDAVAVVQDRIREKAFIKSTGVPVAPYAPILVRDDIVAAPAALFPGILKVARLGYDGKGQARVTNVQEALDAFEQFQQAECVLEAMLPLASELSVVMARGADGQTMLYDSAQNEHRDGILAVSSVDASLLDTALAEQAAASAIRIAQAQSGRAHVCTPVTNA